MFLCWKYLKEAWNLPWAQDHMAVWRCDPEKRIYKGSFRFSSVRGTAEATQQKSLKKKSPSFHGVAAAYWAQGHRWGLEPIPASRPGLELCTGLTAPFPARGEIRVRAGEHQRRQGAGTQTAILKVWGISSARCAGPSPYGKRKYEKTLSQVWWSVCEGVGGEAPQSWGQSQRLNLGVFTEPGDGRSQIYAHL